MSLFGKVLKKDGARRRKRDGQGDDVADDSENSQLGSRAVCLAPRVISAAEPRITVSPTGAAAYKWAF